jgi:signal transduction histidine kinase
MEGTGWQPIRGDDGTVSAVLAVSRDVTERERVERERREMLSRIVAAGEEERRRIADDVHDAPIQALTALGIRLETLRSRLPDPDAHELLDRVESSVESSIAALRTLMFELRPPVLDREGLVPALRDYLAGVVDQHAPGFAYEVHDRLAREPAPGSRIVLYRIVQEAIVNVRKHAGASRVAVTVASVDGGTSVRVEDDGSGLPGELAPRPGHIGISAMRERAEYAGGRFSVTGRAGGGTVVEAWVPER